MWRYHGREGDARVSSFNVESNGFAEMWVNHLNVLTGQGELDNTLLVIPVNLFFKRSQIACIPLMKLLKVN